MGFYVSEWEKSIKRRSNYSIKIFKGFKIDLREPYYKRSINDNNKQNKRVEYKKN